MTLPHRINITSGGTGADPGEMFFGCQVDRIDGPPGTGSRAFSPGEDALSKNFNRSAFALAENDEYLGDIVVKRELAYKEVGVLAAFSANNIKIDPSGASLGNVNYTGSLYLGEAGWPASQENLDSLFQLLDENYNEVIVDGVEVKITSIQAPRAVGDEFVTTITQLNLNKTVPSANYRIAYGRGTTLENIPAYSLIGADIRGLHEAAGETNRKAFVVCTPAGGTGDFAGADAVLNALAAYPSGDVVIFIRNGSYNIANAGITAVPRGVTLVGEAVSGPGVANGVILLLNGAGGIVLLGADSHIEKIQFRAATPDGTQILAVFNANCSLRNASIDQLKLSVSGDWSTIENVRILPYDVAIEADQSNHSKFKNIEVSEPAVDTASELVLFSGNTEGLVVTDLNVTITTAGFSVGGITLSGAATYFQRTRFDNCYVQSQDGIALSIIGKCWGVSFEDCAFYSDRTIVDTGSTVYDLDISFRNCYFDNQGSAWYRTHAARLMSTTPSGGFTSTGGVVLENCHFSDSYCTGNTDPADPGGVPTAGVAFPVLEFSGVSGRNVSFQRTLLAYNVEDSPWMSLSNCRINGVTLNASGGTFTPFSYAGYSDGIIEVLGQSFITDLRYVNALKDEVHRSVVFVHNTADYTSTTDVATDLPAVIDGLHIAFDDGSAYFNSETPAPYEHGMLLTMDGNAIVRRFVMNNDVKFQVKTTMVTNYTNVLILLKGRYNTFEDFQIYLKAVDQGTVSRVIVIGSADNDHQNIVQNGKIHIEHTVVDALKYPIHAISALYGSGVIVNGVTVYMTTPDTDMRAIYINSFFSRVVNCHVDIDGDCATESGLIAFDSDGINGPAETCTCIGNIMRARTLLAGPPTIVVGGGGTLGADVGNVLIKQTTPAYPTE